MGGCQAVDESADPLLTEKVREVTEQIQPYFSAKVFSHLMERPISQHRVCDL